MNAWFHSLTEHFTNNRQVIDEVILVGNDRIHSQVYHIVSVCLFLIFFFLPVYLCVYLCACLCLVVSYVCVFAYMPPCLQYTACMPEKPLVNNLIDCYN